jgi:hypothetical protein
VRPAWLAIVLTVGGLAPAIAQEIPIVDVSGGYSLLAGGGEPLDGWYVTAAGNVTDWFALVGEVNWHARSEQVPAYGDVFPGGRFDLDSRAFLVGPRFAFRNRRVAIFVHVKGGVVSEHSSFAGDDYEGSNAALDIGAGIDVWFARRMAVRTGVGSQVYLGEDHVGMAARLHTGVVFGLGSR